MSTFYARNVEEVQSCVREHAAAASTRDDGERPMLPPQQPPSLTPPPAMQHEGGRLPLRPVAGRSKSALSSASASANGPCVMLDVSALHGVIDYQPDECTFTARAATPVADVEAMLAARGQYLPFDPPFAPRGATLGGTVATGLSGPGRFRYGGVRDFLLGVRFVDGEGRAIRGGGRVVKNAAGFYLQHLLLGSLGTLGVLTEVTFKVFPLPRTRMTLIAECGTLAAAIDTLSRLRRSTFELEAAELIPPARLLLRIGGSPDAIEARADNLAAWLRDGTPGAEVRAIADTDEERQYWLDARELAWAPPDAPLVKVATTLGCLADLDRQLAAASVAAPAGAIGAAHAAATAAAQAAGTAEAQAATHAAAKAAAPKLVPRRYGAGGDVAWLAWPGELSQLDALLTELKMPGLVVLAGERAPYDPLLGPRPDAAFLARVRQTLDPRGVFTARHD